ncbi:MAG: hypothetical protein PHD97_10030 [Bacteroidales bacterium]|nr:hypothetical protein [Bacteroidales bacterium]
MRFFSLIFVIGFCLLCFGCKTWHNIVSADKKDISDKTNAPVNELLFINFKITKDTLSGKTEILLLNKNTVNGTLKKNQDKNNENIFNDYLQCIFTNKKNDTVEVQIIEHPLIKQIEYVDSNNQLGRKNIKIKEAEFFIRITNNASIEKLTINEILNKNNKKNICNFKLK